MKGLKASPLVILPLAVIVGTALILGGLYVLRGQKTQFIIILVLTLPLALILLGWMRRQITWDHKSFKYKGILGTKEVPWSEISEVRIFRAGLKKVLYLGSREKVLIIPLIFSHQEELARAFQDHLSLEGIPTPEELRLSFGETLLLWTGALLLVIILATKIL
jgi:hypothetical protein